MTAFDRYQRLEGPGLWAAGQGMQRRDVVIRFGKATMVIVDSRSDMVLSHWSLSAIRRLNPGQTPARFIPADASRSDDTETLDIDEPLLLEAMETLTAALAAPRNKGEMRRRFTLGAGAILLAGLLVVWLPGAVVRHTAGVVPLAKRVQIGQMILADMTTDPARSICRAEWGSAALQVLGNRLFAAPRSIVVIDAFPPGAPATLNLPGRHILVDNRLILNAETPEELAGFLLAEAERASRTDPLQGVLRHAGLTATIRLLTQGDLPADTVTGYASTLFSTTAAMPDSTALGARFEATRLDPTPWLSSLPVQDRPHGLSADALNLPNPLSPLITDNDWIRIQTICDS